MRLTIAALPLLALAAPLPATATDREVAGAVATLNDPATQERAIAGALVDLYRKNSNQAVQMLQSSGISSQVQQAALSRMTNRGPWWR